MNDAFTKYTTTLITNNEDKVLIEAVIASWNQYIQCSDEMLTFSRKNQTEKATELLNGESATYFEKFSADCLKLVEMNKT